MIPEYDYLEVAQIIEDIDAKIAMLKHAINLNNAMAKVPVGDEKNEHWYNFGQDGAVEQT